MAIYEVTDPDSGRTLTLEGDAPPTEEELEGVFSQFQVPTVATPQPAIVQGAGPESDFSSFDKEPESKAEGMPFDLEAALGNFAIKAAKGTGKGLLEVARASGLGGMIDAFTGQGKTTAETAGVGEIVGESRLPVADIARIGALMTTTVNPQEQQQALSGVLDNAEFKTDDKGVTTVSYDLPDGSRTRSVLNAPGMSPQDLNQSMFQILSFIPAAKLSAMGSSLLARVGLGMTTSGATQTGIEGLQAAQGGTIDPGDVAAVTALGGAAELLPALGQGLPAMTPKAPAPVRFGPRPGSVIPEAEVSGPAPVIPSAPVAEVGPSLKEVSTAGRKAAEGGLGASRAKRVLAEQAAPDPKVIAAAERLGVSEFLQPDHVSTSQAFREFSQAVKSIPGSKARAAELAGYEQIGKRADDLIEEIGGTTDLSRLDASVKTRMAATQEGLEKQADDLYGKLKESIPAKADAPADNLLGFLESKADDLGGVEFLEPLERGLIKKLSPTAEGAQPTYARLDNIRKQLTASRVRKEGPFKDADTGLIKKLEKELLKDQQLVAKEFGQEELFDAARKSVAVRKGLESDMAALFGKNLDGTILSNLSSGTKKLAEGDVSKFIKLLRAVPEGSRKEVVASGLNAAFGKNARNGQLNFTSYAKWFEGLKANKQAMNALMSNLPKEARKSLTDLYKVSNGIRKASRERITTGRLTEARNEIEGADRLMGNIFGLAKRSAGGAAAEVVTTAVGIPGAGISAGIASALTKGKPSVLQAADELINSPEFIQAAAKVTPAAAAKLAKSPAFKRFSTAVGNPRELTNPETWILSALRTQSQPDETE